MQNLIKQIYQFNKDAGLLEKGYSDFLESSFQVEEALEGFTLPPHGWTIDKTNPKDLSRQIINYAQMEDSSPISDVDRLDKACDAVVFAVGSMAKLGLNPQQITAALNIVMTHNQIKLKMPKDSYGKLTKPEGFVGPEPKLQELLDQRS